MEDLTRPTRTPLLDSSTSSHPPSYQGGDDSVAQPQRNTDDLRIDSSDSEFFWKFADFGNVGRLSRDGSEHATDEVFNSISHLTAFFLSIQGGVLLISEASAQGAPWKIVSFSIYSLCLCFLFAASTLHHAITTTRKWEQRLRMLDYLSIFPLIAGTFTPLCLVYFPYSTVGWSFFSVVWVLSLGCMYIVSTNFEKVPKWLTMTMYVTLGWLGAFLTFWVWPLLGVWGTILLILGGLLYTSGGYIYATEWPNPVPGRFGFHELWHIFVILAAASHWVMMYACVLPWNRS